MAGDLSAKLSQKTNVFGLKLWVLICVGVGILFVLILFMLSLWLISRKKLKMLATLDKLHSTVSIPSDSKEIKEVKVDRVLPSSGGGVILAITDTTGEGEPEKVLVRVGVSRKGSLSGDRRSSRGQSKELVEHQSLLQGQEVNRIPHSGFSVEEDEGRRCTPEDGSSHLVASSGELASEDAHFGWGHWFTLRDLQIATNGFSKSNVLGEGGYGIVYKGRLANGTMVAVKSLLNNMGQAEREFRVEVEAIGRVRHKNLVRFLGYCMEGTHRMLVYEYVDNGNLEQWLHNSSSCFTWENRMRVIIGTAKALAYLHEALEPKVVHRDIKSSNILIDSHWNAKVSDFGLAKLLGTGKSHVTTRVMGTFGYVAPEYASTGLLNERSDVYSFGVLLLETITGRDPVDYARPAGEVNLVDWLKVMVGNRRSEEVVDPNLNEKPSPRVLKRVLLIALRCVDPESEKRPKMGHVVHMLESEDFPYRDARALLSS
ncbi:hypothetical protein KP509_15G013600 [Ceratopteris richardii]|uniref:non-specific serine/threonine protein kinase n=1 Tax=Ceratopteris richardii TaxID=49495 RepID=A0A8T2T5F6_CERRI|nr:hypothetical protein KP509_15G013600 [Ceratopteris richardii]KAH7404169.1 hypothetical protein KP509_15G013600 [Ceratopteris richardii]KAH7404170.1 hypothetical protein KP509_15G013600 [Ceratopteris richardii]